MKRCLIILVVLLVNSTALRAELLPAFEMDRCVGDARLIVCGLLNGSGKVEVQRVLKGESPSFALTLANGSQIYQWLLSSMKGEVATDAVEVVAFLSGQAEGLWQPVWGHAGVAGLAHTNVYLFGFGKELSLHPRQPTAGRDEHFTREGFLATISDRIKVSNQLDSFLAMARSAERAEKLVSFLLQHREWYYRWRITTSLRPLNSDEQEEILKELANAADSAEQCFLLDLAGDIPLAKDAFRSIAPSIDKGNPRAVRRAAMRAISRINPSEATTLVLPLITMREPELDAALAALEPPDNSPLYSEVIQGLLNLAKEVRQQDSGHTQSLSGAAQQALRLQLGRYVHSELLSFYFHWLLDGTAPAPDHVTLDIQTMLGVHWPRAELEAWWHQERKNVEPAYDLQKSADQRIWFAAYQSADEVAQRLLVRLWMFASETNQLALVKAATESQTEVAAKATITELWDAGRLGNAGKKGMFERFLELALVEEPNVVGVKGWRELVIEGKLSFPFKTEVCYCYAIGADSDATLEFGGESSVVLEPRITEFHFGSRGGALPGRFAKAIVEIYQPDRQSNGRKLWSIQRALGPIELTEE